MQGFPEDAFLGRPIIGILNSWSEVAGCNAHLRELAEHVKRGVLRAGGFPVEVPVISLGEPIIKPTAMLYRNLMAMAVEELIRGNPLDGAVLLASCDKTVPAALMGAASVDIPALMVTGGPMLSGRFRQENVGACTDCWRLNDELRAGRITEVRSQHAHQRTEPLPAGVHQVPSSQRDERVVRQDSCPQGCLHRVQPGPDRVLQDRIGELDAEREGTHNRSRGRITW